MGVGFQKRKDHIKRNHKIIKYNCCINNEVIAPNPDPSRWKLLRFKQFKNACVLKVKYLDCTNFEGKKIMVYLGNKPKSNYLDPHFSEDKESPIARFRPDKNGWEMAINLAKSL